MVATNFYIDYLINTKLLQEMHCLLKDLCGLRLNILDRRGKSKHFSFPKTTSHNNRHSDTNRKTHHNDPCIIEEQTLKTVITSKRYTIFVDAYHMKNLLVPVIFREQVIAFLQTKEDHEHSVTENQLHSVSNFLNDLLLKIVKDDLAFLNEFTGNEMTHQRKVINKVLDYIRSYYHSSDLTLSTVSQKTGISYHYLCRLFKQELKTNFTLYVNKLRTDVASRLLKDASLSISQISYSCGFEDPSYFSKVFKKIYGTSPADFRNTSTIVTMPRQ